VVNLSPVSAPVGGHAAWEVMLPALPCAGAVLHVLRSCGKAKRMGVHATALMARVVHLHTCGDRAARLLPRVAVGVDHPPVVPNFPLPVAVHRPDPDDASGIAYDGLRHREKSSFGPPVGGPERLAVPLPALVVRAAESACNVPLVAVFD